MKQMSIYDYEPDKPGVVTTFETRGESNEKVDKKKRYSQILEILEEKGSLTAKEIAVEMCRRGWIPTSERNFASPRLTEMLYDGRVETDGKKTCQYSGVKVALFRIRKDFKNENI